MPYYLAPWEFDSDEGAFVPQGASGASVWAAVDLRSDATVADGYCLLWSKTGLTGDGLIQLPDVNADQPDLDRELPRSRADEVAAALGVAKGKMRGRSTRTLIAGALTDLASDLGINEVRPDRDGVRRIRMGGAGVVWDEGRDG